MIHDPYTAARTIGFTYQGQDGPHSIPGKHVAHDNLTGDLLVSATLDEFLSACESIRYEQDRLGHPESAHVADQAATQTDQAEA